MMIKILLAVLIVAAVSTASDYTWYEIGVQHRMTAGIITGAVMLMAVGGALGWIARRTTTGMVVGVVAGVVGALAYYAMVPSMGQRAMIAAWAVVWIVLAIGDGRLVQRGRVPWSIVLLRGVAAAVLSGLAFYVMSDDLWGRAPAGGRNYAMQLARWVVAWAPGIIAIAWPPRGRG
jgi:hypothetical protein